MRPGDAVCNECSGRTVAAGGAEVPCGGCGEGTTLRFPIARGSPLCTECELHYFGNNITTRILDSRAETQGRCVRCGEVTSCWAPGVPRLELATRLGPGVGETAIPPVPEEAPAGLEPWCEDCRSDAFRPDWFPGSLPCTGCGRSTSAVAARATAPSDPEDPIATGTPACAECEAPFGCEPGRCVVAEAADPDTFHAELEVLAPHLPWVAALRAVRTLLDAAATNGRRDAVRRWLRNARPDLYAPEDPRSVEYQTTIVDALPYGDTGWMQAPGPGWSLVSCTPITLPPPPGSIAAWDQRVLECVWVRR